MTLPWLRKIADSTLYDDAEIWIDGFISFTPQEYKIIGELLKRLPCYHQLMH